MKRSRAEPSVQGGAGVNIIRLNVGGEIFTSSRSTLQAVPSSLSLEIWLNFDIDNYKQRSKRHGLIPKS